MREYIGDDDLKLPPYKRLKSILNDGDLTQKGEDNLNALLGIDKKRDNFLVRVFKKIDSMIFKKPSKITNNPHKRLK